MLLSASDFAALMRELESLRRAVGGTGAAAAAVSGGAGLGSIVRVVDRAGRTTEYELIERAGSRERVALGSPVGQALLGARPGDHINIIRGDGRRRRVRVVAVKRPAPVEPPAEAGH